MIYPRHIKEPRVGVTAPSAGVGDHLVDYEKSLENLNKEGITIIETASVRNEGEVSNTKEIRAKEFNELVTDDNIDMIMCATGGDFLVEILPYINYDNIKKNPKWIMGASDPTSLLYYITTTLDIATIYGHNAGSYDAEKLHESQKISLDIIKGNIREQNSYSLYEVDKNKRIDGYALEKPVIWKSINKEVNITGRIIGGCIDCLKDIIGTRFDNTKQFIEKYKEDGIIWYFDIFALTSEDFYRTLLQMKEADWFNYLKGIVVGRVRFPNSFTSMTYEKALKKVFPNLPIIIDADIGHVPPKMTIINGSIVHIESNNGKGKILLKEK